MFLYGCWCKPQQNCNVLRGLPVTYPLQHFALPLGQAAFGFLEFIAGLVHLLVEAFAALGQVGAEVQFDLLLAGLGLGLGLALEELGLTLGVADGARAQELGADDGGHRPDDQGCQDQHDFQHADRGQGEGEGLNNEGHAEPLS